MTAEAASLITKLPGPRQTLLSKAGACSDVVHLGVAQLAERVLGEHEAAGAGPATQTFGV